MTSDTAQVAGCDVTELLAAPIGVICVGLDSHRVSRAIINGECRT